MLLKLISCFEIGIIIFIIVFTGDPDCETGIISGNACCDINCGSCGGSDCSTRPGGSTNCCFGTITSSDVLCTDSLPPCIITTTLAPTHHQTPNPASSQTPSPTSSPIDFPTPSPTNSPTTAPTDIPTPSPTSSPIDFPTPASIDIPTPSPTSSPTSSPTDIPTPASTDSPTLAPTDIPTPSRTDSPTESPTDTPTPSPTNSPISAQNDDPILAPTDTPTTAPTDTPTSSPTRDCIDIAFVLEEHFIDWEDARLGCWENNADLVTFSTQTDVNILSTMCSDSGYNYCAVGFVDYIDDNICTFKFINGEPLIASQFNFSPNEPDHCQSSTAGGFVRNDYRLADFVITDGAYGAFLGAICSPCNLPPTPIPTSNS